MKDQLPLLRCPTCGEMPEEYQMNQSTNGGVKVLYYWVECPGTPPCTTGPCHSTPEEAADGWNKKVSPDRVIKRLSPAVRNDLELKNHARVVNGLGLLRIMVKTCTVCGGLFESAGNRTCGCTVKTKGK